MIHRFENKALNKTVLAALFVVLGLAVPFATAHAFAIPGTILLPMYIPVLLGAMICGPRLGVLIGLLTPLLSSLLTGMPAAFPALPALVAELTLLGGLSGWGYRVKGRGFAGSMVPAILAGRVVNGMTLAALLGLKESALMLGAGFYTVASGAPGVLLQLVAIPIIMKFLEKNSLVMAPWAENYHMPQEALREARELISSGLYTCVVIKDGKIIHKADGRGVAPLLHLYRNEPEKLKGALVADKIIGKAGAMIVQLGGAEALFAELLSKSARAFLTEHQMPHRWGRCINFVTNRQGNGICPIERSVMDIDDPALGLEAITATVAQLMAAKAQAQGTNP